MKGLFFLLSIFVCTLKAAEAVSGIEDDDTLKRLSATENLVQDLLREVNILKSRDKLRQNKVAHLEKQLRLQRKHSSKLNRMLRTMKACDKVTVSDPLEETVDLTQDKTLIKKDKVGASRNRIRRQDVESPIAFFAKMDAHLEHAGVHQTVVFDVVVTNLGNGYNNHIGVFVAPVSGTYVFSTTLVSRHFSCAVRC